MAFAINGLMACSRAHVLKAALVAGFILLLLNVFGPRLEFKNDKSINVMQKSALQWPKRTRSSNSIVQHHTIKNNNHTKPPHPQPQPHNNSILNNNDTAAATNATNSIPYNSNYITPSIAAVSSSDPTILPTSAFVTEIVNLKVRNKSGSNEVRSSTKSNFLQSLMTTLGLNQCPPTPPDLEGKIAVDTKYEVLSVIEKRFGPKLQPGGWYHPSECNARHKVAIIVPYRDRKQHLSIFLKHMHPFLMKQQLEYGIFIVEQTSGSLFNRASLLNIGATEALKVANWDCFVFHDIDLLPLDDRNLYTCPEQPRHMSVAIDVLGFKLPYNAIFGGVSSMTVKQFKTVNGFSNIYWGWGGEDDDMYSRLKHAGFYISRYPLNIARYAMLSHRKEKPNPKRYALLETGLKRAVVDGLNSLNYNLKSFRRLPLYTWLLVDIKPEQTS